MRKGLQFCALVCLAVLLAGCVSTVPVQSSFWNRKGERVGVAMATLPEAHAHRVGSQMLLDIAINKALASRLDARMKEVAPTMLGSATDSFVKRLNDLGFQGKKITEPIDLDAFPEFTGGGGGEVKAFRKDVRPLAQKYNIDLLLLISVDRYGTLRKYYGFVPLGAPKALFQARGQMIDLKNNQLLFQKYLGEDQSTVAVEGEWSQPPDYPNLIAALDRAINKTMGNLETTFFEAAK